MRFLQQAIEQQRRKILLSQLLLLILRCLALILLGLALSQPLLAGWLTSGSNRVIHLFIDDTLTTNATDPTQNQTRFQVLKEEAISLLDELAPNDTLFLKTLSGINDPGPLAPQTSFNPIEDRAELIDQINNLKPTQLARGTRRTFADQRDSLKTAAATDPNSQHLALVLSDFALSNTRWQPAEANPAEPNNQNPQWLLREPMPSQPNDQVRQLTPRRQVAIPDATGRNLRLYLTAQLARFTDTPVERTAQLQWQVFDEQARPLLTTNDTIRLRPDETTRTLSRVLTLPVDQPLPPNQDTAQLFIQLTWLPDNQPDPLPLDNRALTSIEARRTATLLIQHDGRPGLTSARWLALAFNPTQNDTTPITPRLVTTLTPTHTTNADALLITSPNALTPDDRAQLRAFAEQNKPILLLPPENASAQASTLFQQLGIENASFGPLRETGTPATTFTESLPNSGPLSLLAAEWSTLARTITTTRYHALDFPSSQPLISLRTPNGIPTPWLLTSNLNRSPLLLFASRIEPAWTNLPIKPLAVPLFQTLLRDTLTPQTLVPQSRIHADSPQSNFTPNQIGLISLNDDAETTHQHPQTHAGLWRINTDDQHFFITQIQPEAANLTAADRQLVETFLSPDPTNITWVAPNNWAQALDDPTPSAPAGRPILWIALAALLTELAIARWSASGDRRWW